MNSLRLGKQMVGLDHPTYFVADIAANHDADFERAKLLIRLCAEAGANAAKFQNFRASKIVSDRGFRALGAQVSHQAGWKKSVFEVYHDATVPWEWTPLLKQECDACGIDYFSTPYDAEAVDMLDAYAGSVAHRIVGVDTRSELRKVVWPTRKEALQMTGYVFAFVVVMALFLWFTDKTLEWVLYDLILGWKR